MTEPPLATQPSLGNQFSGALAGLRFVGRAHQLSQLIAALPPSAHAIKLVTGDAGIGKSRLVAEAIASAESRGHRVVFGRCRDSEAAPAFWPWTQVVRSLLNTSQGTDLGALVLDDPTATRSDLFHAVAELLRTAQESAPLVIVLEDLHDADQPSLALLQFLVRQRESLHILFIGTFRARDVSNTTIGDKLRALSKPGVRIDLRGLSVTELQLLIPEGGPEPTELHAITGGNPLFAEQVLRLWVSRGELSAARGFVGVTTDSSLRSVTRSRIERLPEESRHALSAIGVYGRPVSITDLARLIDESVEKLGKRLTPALSAGVLEVSEHLGDAEEISFTHVLLANAAVELTSNDELCDLHRRCAETLADRPGYGAERAHHLLQSGASFAEEALTACEVAGKEAMAALAFEDAVSHYRQALRVIDLLGAGGAQRRVLVVIELGIAQWAIGDFSDADASFATAWEAATLLEDPRCQALVALGPGFRFEFSGIQAKERALRCTTALEALSKDPSPLRARLLATLAAAQLVDADQRLGQHVASQALNVAQQVGGDRGDDLAIGYALVAKVVTDLDPDTLDDRLASARRILAIARAHGDRELAANGYFLLLAAFLEAGDIRAIDAELDPHHNAVHAFMQLRDSRHAEWFRCSRTLLDGNSELAEQFANSSFELAKSHQDPDAQSVWIAQISIVRWMQGRASEIEPYYLQARHEEPWRHVWIAVLAWLWAVQGRHGEASAAVKEIGPLSDIPRDRHWLLTMTTLAEVVAVLGDEENALIRYAPRLVPIGLGVAVWGTVARPLGLLARLLGRHEEAVSHFRQAILVCTRAGAMPWLVESQLDLAEMLRDVGDREPPAEATSLARQAHATAKELGLTVFMQRAVNVLASLGIDAPADTIERDGMPMTGSTHASIIVMGRFEVTASDGSVPHWTSRKARMLLQLLVAARGATVSRERMMDTLWPGEEPSALSNRMSVAISTVRRALDPARSHPPHYFLRAQRSVLQLNRDTVSIDVDTFLDSAREAMSEHEATSDAAMSRSIELYTGDVFADEPYEEWAVPLRTEAQNTFAALCRRRGESAALRNNPLLAAELFRKVLSVDSYDANAHVGLIAALEALGVERQARLAREHYLAIMSELAS